MLAENAAHRSIAACLGCRSRKQKCDGLSSVDGTCTRCKQNGKRCVWPAPVPPAVSIRAQQQQLVAAAAIDVSSVAGPSRVNAAPSAMPPVGGFSTTPPTRQAPPKRGATGRHQTNGSGSGTLDDDDAAHPRPVQRPRRRYSESVTPRNPAPLASLREMALLTPAADAEQGGRWEATEKLAHDEGDCDDASQNDIDEQIHALQAQTGWTSARLQEASVERRQFFRDAVAPEPSSLERIDPLHIGLLEAQDAARLFDLFYATINVQHCLLDARHDDWHSVHLRSRALFIVICAATAAIDEHATSRRCVATLATSMDEAVRQVLQSNAKSVEVVQTLLLAFLYGQTTTYARDDMCWTLVDAAARIASELGLGQRLRSAPAMATPADATDDDDAAQRNAERAWALAILMQRSLGTFTGLWSVTKLDVQWDSLEKWCESNAGTAGDVQHAAYLNLRRIEYFARSQLEKMQQKRFLSLEAIRVSFNALFEEWHQRWVEHVKLAQHDAIKSCLMVIGLHIRLLINFTALRLAQDSNATASTTLPHNDEAGSASSSLLLQCAELAKHFCHHFLDNFQRRATHLGRNIVSMVTWSVLVLLQLEYRRGRLLATRVAVLLAGQADDVVHRRTFPRFYGRWLLSLIHDLACTSSERKAVALLRNVSRDCRCASKESCAHAGRAAAGAASGGVKEATPTTTAAGAKQTSLAAPSPAARRPGNAVSAEKVLAHMTGPMTTDPFNEVWLNSFLDSLVPPPYSPDEVVGAPQAGSSGGG